jgi:serine/threonine-protein kinase ULK4
MAYELVQGLSYLHENGIIYADLKPTNILINEFSNLKLGDFGLSKKISDLMQAIVGGDAEGNKKGSSGTPYYMAPELFQDDGVLSFYSDFWSLGCIMYELAVGKPPFCASSLQQLI